MISLAFAQTDITIGTGTSTGRYPLNDYFLYSRSQCIYLETEIGAPGTIHELRWYRNDTGADPSAIGTTEIWLKTTTSSVLTDVNWETPGTLVATISNIDLGAGGGWYTVDIDDFVYTGGNLMVSAYTQNAPYTTPHAYWRYTTTTGFNRCRLGNSDTVNPPTLSLSTSRPNIQINMTTGAPSAVPNPAVLISPLNGGWAFLNQTLSWGGGGGFPATYDVYFGTSATPPFVINQATTTYTPTLAANTTYYWQIVPRNAVGPATGCPIWSFKTPTTTQLAESFESNTFPPAGWTNPGTWYRDTAYVKHGVGVAAKYGSSSTQYVLSGPKVTITGTSTLNFWSLNSSTSGQLQVVYSPDRVTWTPIVGGNVTYAATYTYYNSIIDLSSLQGNNYYLGFRTGLQYAYFYVDAVFGPEITPEAPNPVTLVLPADLSTGLSNYPTFTWTAATTGGVPSGYRVYCDANPTPTTLIGTATGQSFSPTAALNWGAIYYWTVEAYNATGTAARPTPFSFTTMPDPTITVFPYEVNFGTVAGDWPVLNWSQLQGLYGGTYVAGSQWARDEWLNGAAGNNAAKINIYGTSRYGWLITPPVSIPATDYEIKFDMALLDWNGTVPPVAGEQADDRLLLVMSSSPLMTSPTILAEWNNTGSPLVFDAIPHTGLTYTFPLTGISGVKYFAWYGESTLSGGDNDLMIDNVIIRQTPSLPVFALTPDVTSWDFGPVMINTTATKQFTISNTGGGNISISSVAATGTYYSISIPPSDTELAAGEFTNFTVQYAPTAAGVNQPGNLDITYTGSSRDVKHVDLLGTCVDPTISVFPYNEGFETVTVPALPLGWTVIDNNADNDKWVTSTSYPKTGTKNAVIYTDYNAANDDYLVTPPVVLSGNKELKFWVRAHSASEADEISILLSTTTPTVAAFTNELMASTPVTSTTYTEYTVNLGAYSGTCYISFTRRNAPADGYYLHLDDVLIRDVPTAPIFTITPPELTWDFGTGVVNTPITKQYTIQNTGAGTGALTINSVIASGTYYSISVPPSDTELLAGESTTFTVQYLPTATGGPHTGTVTVSYTIGTRTDHVISLTGSAIPYGVSTATNTADDDIGQVILGTFANPAVAPTPILSNPTSIALYTDYTAVGPIDIQQAVATSFSLLQIEGGTTLYSCYYKVFIDYNQNQAFDLPGEIAFESASGSSNPNPTTGSITVPLSATLGNTRMRVVLVEFGSTTSVLPVGTYTWGETEDYTVNITAPPALIAPSALTVSNLQAQQVTLGWTENNTPPATTWDIKYGIGTFDPLTAGTLVSGVTTNPYTLLGLTSETGYTWYVRSDTGGRDLTDWSVQGSFLTPPLPATLPYAVNFGTVVGDWPIPFWSQLTGLYGGTPVAGTQWYQDDWGNTVNTNGKAAKINIYGTSYYGWLVTRAIDIPAARTDYELKFDMALMVWADTVPITPGEQADDKLIVVMSDNADMSSPTILREWNNTTSPDVYDDIPATGQTYTISLVGISGVKYFAWYGESTVAGGDNDLMIDNVIFRSVPTGPPDPVTLDYPVNEQSDLPKNGFNLTWTPALTGGTPTNYGVYLDDNADIYDGYLNYWETGNTNTHYNPVTEGMYTFAYSTTYYWTVEAINGAGSGLQETESRFTIQDVPPIIDTFPYVEDFEDNSDFARALPLGWTRSSNGVGWEIGLYTDLYWDFWDIGPDNTTVFACANDDGAGSTNDGSMDLMTMAQIDLSGTDPGVPIIGFDTYFNSLYGSSAYLEFSVDSGATWEVLYELPADTGWITRNVGLAAYIGNNNLRLRFHADDNAGWSDGWAIDNVTIYYSTVDVYPPTIEHLHVLNTPRDDINYLVAADIADDTAFNNGISAANLYYSTDGGTTYSAPIAMTLDVAPTYYAYIPAQPMGTDIQYYMVAIDNAPALNETTSDTYYFSVDDPIWVNYDLGGTTYLGYTGVAFGPMVMFENPFYGTGTPMLLNATDGEAYDNVTPNVSVPANLHVYTWDGVGDLIDVITPLPVSFAHQVQTEFDLTSYNIQITDPYFFISFEDIPAGGYYFNFDESVDYGTTYVWQTGVLYTLGRYGVWAIGANVGAFTLDAPVVTIALVGGVKTLSWDAIDGAVSYNIYGADDPYGAWTPLGSVAALTYPYTGTEDYKFFYVTASSDALPSAVRLTGRRVPFSVTPANVKTNRISEIQNRIANTIQRNKK